MSHSTVSQGSGIRMFVRNRPGGRSLPKGRPGGGWFPQRWLLLRQGAQSAQGAVLGDPDGTG
ncbi:hypothetical protein GCM10027073_08790 [Streptomyces chlorus]